MNKAFFLGVSVSLFLATLGLPALNGASAYPGPGMLAPQMQIDPSLVMFDDAGTPFYCIDSKRQIIHPSLIIFDHAGTPFYCLESTGKPILRSQVTIDAAGAPYYLGKISSSNADLHGSFGPIYPTPIKLSTVPVRPAPAAPYVPAQVPYAYPPYGHPAPHAEALHYAPEQAYAQHPAAQHKPEDSEHDKREKELQDKLARQKKEFQAELDRQNERLKALEALLAAREGQEKPVAKTSSGGAGATAVTAAPSSRRNEAHGSSVKPAKADKKTASSDSSVDPGVRQEVGQEGSSVTRVKVGRTHPGSSPEQAPVCTKTAPRVARNEANGSSVRPAKAGGTHPGPRAGTAPAPAPNKSRNEASGSSVSTQRERTPFPDQVRDDDRRGILTRDTEWPALSTLRQGQEVKPPVVSKGATQPARRAPQGRKTGPSKKATRAGNGHVRQSNANGSPVSSGSSGAAAPSAGRKVAPGSSTKKERSRANTSVAAASSKSSKGTNIKPAVSAQRKVQSQERAEATEKPSSPTPPQVVNPEEEKKNLASALNKAERALNGMRNVKPGTTQKKSNAVYFICATIFARECANKLEAVGEEVESKQQEQLSFYETCLNTLSIKEREAIKKDPIYESGKSNGETKLLNKRPLRQFSKRTSIGLGNLSEAIITKVRREEREREIESSSTASAGSSVTLTADVAVLAARKAAHKIVTPAFNSRNSGGAAGAGAPQERPSRSARRKKRNRERKAAKKAAATAAGSEPDGSKEPESPCAHLSVDKLIEKSADAINQIKAVRILNLSKRVKEIKYCDPVTDLLWTQSRLKRDHNVQDCDYVDADFCDQVDRWRSTNKNNVGKHVLEAINRYREFIGKSTGWTFTRLGEKLVVDLSQKEQDFSCTALDLKSRKERINEEARRLYNHFHNNEESDEYETKGLELTSYYLCALAGYTDAYRKAIPGLGTMNINIFIAQFGFCPTVPGYTEIQTRMNGYERIVERSQELKKAGEDNSRKVSEEAIRFALPEDFTEDFDWKRCAKAISQHYQNKVLTTTSGGAAGAGAPNKPGTRRKRPLPATLTQTIQEEGDILIRLSEKRAPINRIGESLLKHYWGYEDKESAEYETEGMKYASFYLSALAGYTDLYREALKQGDDLQKILIKKFGKCPKIPGYAELQTRTNGGDSISEATNKLKKEGADISALPRAVIKATLPEDFTGAFDWKRCAEALSQHLQNQVLTTVANGGAAAAGAPKKTGEKGTGILAELYKHDEAASAPRAVQEKRDEEEESRRLLNLRKKTVDEKAATLYACYRTGGKDWIQKSARYLMALAVYTDAYRKVEREETIPRAFLLMKYGPCPTVPGHNSLQTQEHAWDTILAESKSKSGDEKSLAIIAAALPKDCNIEFKWKECAQAIEKELINPTRSGFSFAAQSGGAAAAGAGEPRKDQEITTNRTGSTDALLVQGIQEALADLKIKSDALSTATETLVMLSMGDDSTTTEAKKLHTASAYLCALTVYTDAYREAYRKGGMFRPTLTKTFGLCPTIPGYDDLETRKNASKEVKKLLTKASAMGDDLSLYRGVITHALPPDFTEYHVGFNWRTCAEALRIELMGLADTHRQPEPKVASGGAAAAGAGEAPQAKAFAPKQATLMRKQAELEAAESRLNILEIRDEIRITEGRIEKLLRRLNENEIPKEDQSNIKRDISITMGTLILLYSGLNDKNKNIEKADLRLVVGEIIDQSEKIIAVPIDYSLNYYDYIDLWPAQQGRDPDSITREDLYNVYRDFLRKYCEKIDRSDENKVAFVECFQGEDPFFTYARDHFTPDTELDTEMDES